MEGVDKPNLLMEVAQCRCRGQMKALRNFRSGRKTQGSA
jgi:hypothetical protein